MKPDEALALHRRLVDAFPSVRSLMTPGNAAEWRKWLQALPFRDGEQAVTILVAGSDFPTIHQFLQAAGFDCGPDRPGAPMKPITPATAMLFAAVEGGYELVRDHRAQHGWRSSREALPAPEPVGVPCPPEIAAEIRAKIGHIAESKRVPPVGVRR